MDKKQMPDFQREAEELYPETYRNRPNIFNEANIVDAKRAAHIKARQMSAGEVEELREQVRKLREGLGVLVLCAPAVSSNVLKSPVTLAEYYEALETAKQLLKETEG